jgi:glycosyltransferase involved in cell wall biosynthesis
MEPEMADATHGPPGEWALKAMRISIAMATFNGGRYLRQQLDSFVAQTLRPDQLVITDDGSTDDTVQVALEFARSAPFAVVVEVNPCTLGVTGNFNRALSLCDGDLVLLSDQDDTWFPEKIATLAAMAGNGSGAACWMVDALLTDADLAPTGMRKMRQVRAAGLPATAMVMGCCAAFHRDLLELLLPIPATEPAHDTWLVQVADMLSLVERSEIPMQYYRRHGRNVSQTPVNRIDRPGLGERLLRPLQGMFNRARLPGGLDRERQFLEAAATRLRERIGIARALAGTRADQVVADASLRHEWLAKRLAIRARPRRDRLTSVRALWRRGGYRTSGGLAGAAKDLLLK